MRNDVGALLAKLGQQELKYREFADQFGDMELWPIFEALLLDPRIVGRSVSRLQARREGVRIDEPVAPVPDRNVHPLTVRRRSDAAADDKHNEVRAFLNRLK